MRTCTMHMRAHKYHLTVRKSRTHAQLCDAVAVCATEGSQLCYDIETRQKHWSKSKATIKEVSKVIVKF